MAEYIVKETGYPGRLETNIVGELIRCKDCKWWGYDDDDVAVRVCHASKHGHISPNWSIMIYRTHSGNFYCADAERRIDADMRGE